MTTADLGVAVLAQAGEQTGGTLAFLLPLVLMGGVFYLIAIRPQQRRMRAQQALLRSLEVGDEVMTAGGIFGTITSIDDDEDVVTVEIAPGTEVRMLKGGISRKLVENGDVDEDEDVRSGSEDEEGAGGPP